MAVVGEEVSRRKGMDRCPAQKKIPCLRTCKTSQNPGCFCHYKQKDSPRPPIFVSSWSGRPVESGKLEEDG